jgi:hypothetical protein
VEYVAIEINPDAAAAVGATVSGGTAPGAAAAFDE